MIGPARVQTRWCQARTETGRVLFLATALEWKSDQTTSLYTSELIPRTEISRSGKVRMPGNHTEVN